MSDNPAYDAGRNAALNGLSINDSVYTTGTPENHYWLDGFNSVIRTTNASGPTAAVVLTAEYQAGITAGNALQARTTNPYPQDTIQSNDWMAGWDSTQGTG